MDGRSALTFPGFTAPAGEGAGGAGRFAILKV